MAELTLQDAAARLGLAAPAPTGEAITFPQFESRNGHLLKKVHQGESSGDYTAQNQKSTASGGYGFINETWNRLAKEAGFADFVYTDATNKPGQGVAKRAPPHVQDAVADYAAEHYDPNSKFLWAESAPPGGYTNEPGATTQKRTLSLEDAQDRLKTVSMTPAKLDAHESAKEQPTMDDIIEPGQQAPDKDSVGSAAEAAVIGVGQGLRDVPLGAAQMVAEQVAPEIARQMTQAVNEIDDKFESPKNHPIMHTIGYGIGTTLGIVGGGELLGGVKAVQAGRAVLAPVLERLGIVGRSALVGGTVSTASYNRDPEEASRVLEGTLGTAFGGIVGVLGKGVIAATRTIADTKAYRDFVGAARDFVGDMTPSLSRIKDRFLDRYESLWNEKNAKYTLRNQAGQEIEPGFPREAVGTPAATAITATRAAGVAPTPTTRAVATEVDREFGGPAARADEAAHNQSVKEFDKEMAAWQKTYASGTDRLPPQVRAQALRSDIEGGRIPAPPIHPGEFEPPPITPAQYSAGVQAINRAWARSARDPATRRQLTMIRGEIQSAAKDAAAEAGMDVNEFMTQGEKANKFFRENIVPIQRQFGGKTPSEIRGDPNVPFSGVSPAKFFDHAAKAIEGHDVETLRSFKAMMGDGAKEDLIKVATFQMLQKIDGAALAQTRRAAKAGAGVAERGRPPAEMVDYIREHEENLRELVGRDGVEQLQGYAKIAERLIQQPERHGKLFHALTSHSWMQALGAAEIGMSVLTGQAHRAMVGAGMVLAPYAGHVLYGVLTKMADMPGLLPVIRRAGKTRPDTPEFDKVISEISRRIVATAAVTGRSVAPAANVLAPAVP